MTRPLIAMTQRAHPVPARGESWDCLDANWTVFLDACGLDLAPVPNRVRDCEPFLDRLGVAGIVLSGGGSLSHLEPDGASAERDALEGRLIEYARRRRLPLLGVCRGMQRLCHHLGGSLVRAEGHVAAEHDLIDRSPRLGHGRVNSFHEYGVRTEALPPELRPLACSPDGLVEAVASQDGLCLGIMWHPERVSPFDIHDIRLVGGFFAGRAQE